MNYAKRYAGRIGRAGLAALVLSSIALSSAALAQATCWRSTDGGYAYLCDNGKKITQAYLTEKYGSGWGAAQIRAECGC